MKECSKCLLIKDFSDFKKDATKKDGYYSSCKSCVKEYRKKHYDDNKEFYKERSASYYLNNKDKVKNRVRNYHYERLKTDDLYKLKTRLRTKVYQSFTKKSWIKGGNTERLLGCDYNFAKKHIEKQFLEGMTWNNWGEWHIDHIKPLASAKNEQELRKLFHYTNLQPLWAMDNIMKSDKIILHNE